ncbi:MAG: hypothetical protein DSZ33_05665 [Gammaproteobacteria bacterium]|nr:MAG: hypothetical protein DSZ33_05665 [Gammaproteobacteria bacterium]
MSANNAYFQTNANCFRHSFLMDIPGYQVKKKIGEGGMSSVYLAVQESLQREVALKILNPVFTADTQFTERFLTEGRTIGKLHHPHIVSVYDIGVTDLHHYIAMEHLEGGNLRYRMETDLDAERSADIVMKIAEALAYAHRQGLVHRDIKPENIMFTDGGHPVLTDFGVAKLLRETTRSTCTGITMGTPYYISPEQARGANIDGRSDIYSLGCVFHELLTGSPPYESDDSLAVLYSHVHDSLPVLPDHHSSWQPVLDRMLAKNPDDRFGNAEELLQELHTHMRVQHAEPEKTRSNVLWRSAARLKNMATLLLSMLSFSRWKKPAAFASATFLGSAAGGALLLSSFAKKAAAPAEMVVAVNAHQNDHLAYPGGFLRGATDTGSLSLATSFSDLPGVSVWHGEQAEADGGDAPVLIKPADASSEREFTALREVLQQQIEHNHLTAPDGDNAWQTYMVLAKNYPEKSEVREVPERIAERYLQLAIHVEPDDSSLAATYVERGLKIMPEHDGLLRMKSRLNPKPAKQLAKSEDRVRASLTPVQNTPSSTVATSADVMVSANEMDSSGGDDYMTAERYFYGVGIRRNIAKAAHWYTVSASKGYPEAQSSLGVLYATGNGVEKDVDKAVFWFQKAADQGVAEAQYHLGLSYLLGKGNPIDLDEGKDWIREAAKQNYRKAFIALGWMYDNGIGVEQSVKKAFKWHAKAIRKDISGVLPWSGKKKKVKAVLEWEKIIQPYKSS